MSTEHTTSSQSQNELKEELLAARDLARLEVHLLSMEARSRWKELEKTLHSVEQSLDQGGEKVTETLFTKAREATRAVREFFQGQTPAGQELLAPVRSIMTGTIRSCSPDDTLARAAEVLWEVDCGAVPVVSQERKVVAMITDRDICMAAYTRGRPLSDLHVRDAMSRQLHSCLPEHSVHSVLRLMSRRQVRRVPVVTADGTLVGVVALADIARHLESSIEASSVLAHALASISERRGASLETAAQ